MFSKHEQICSIKIQIARGNNARQYHAALLEAVVERLYHIVDWLGGRMHFAEGEDVHQCHKAITAVEHSVRRLVPQDTVDGIRRLSGVCRRVFKVQGDYFCSLKQCGCSKMFSLFLIQMLPLILDGPMIRAFV